MTLPSSTPEPAVVAAHRTDRRNRRWNIATGLIVVVVAVALVAVVWVKLQQVVAAQQCATRSLNAAIYDARIAFKGDKNPADYQKAPDKC
jgi:hypothetical protein